MCNHHDHTWDGVDQVAETEDCEGTVWECRGCEARFTYSDHGDLRTLQ